MLKTREIYLNDIVVNKGDKDVTLLHKTNYAGWTATTRERGINMTTKEALEEALADINRLIPIIDNIAWKLTYDAENFDAEKETPILRREYRNLLRRREEIKLALKEL